MAHRLQFRRDTRARWLEIDPVLMEGEIGFETDTHNGKVGDGISKYSELEYSNTIAFESITQILGQSTTLVPSQKLVTNEINRIDETIGPWDSTNNETITDEIGEHYAEESDENYNKGLWGQMRNTRGRLSKVEEYNDTVYLNQIDDINLSQIQNKKIFTILHSENRAIPIGKLITFSDDWMHALTQVFITYCNLKEDGTLDISEDSLVAHTHNDIFIYHRYFMSSWSVWMDYLDNPNSRISTLEEYVDKIDLSELDNIATTGNDFLHAIQNKKEYAVIQNFDTLGDVVVGRLTMISDNIHHTISQILTTHLLLNEDGTLSTAHNHNKIFIYHRVKYIGDLTTWSVWEEYNKENETTDSNQTKIIAQHDTLLNPMTLTLNGGGLYEKGTTQTINLTWSAMKGNSPITPVSLLEVWVNDVMLPVDDVSYSEQITESKRFKVMAKFSYDVLGETVTISDTKYASATFVGAMWFGFSEYDTMSEIDMTTGTFIKQSLKTSPSGTYTFNNPVNGYLWLCIPDNMTINKVTMSGFDVPITELNEGGVPGYRNFRSDNELVAGNYTIVIS